MSSVHINENVKQCLISRNIEKCTHNYDFNVREPNQVIFVDSGATSNCIKTQQAMGIEPEYHIYAFGRLPIKIIRCEPSALSFFLPLIFS